MKFAPTPDDFYALAVSLFPPGEKVSASALQTKLQIGYNRARDILRRMEKERAVKPKIRIIPVLCSKRT